jgi:hypothetical protein
MEGARDMGRRLHKNCSQARTLRHAIPNSGEQNHPESRKQLRDRRII